VPEAWDEEGEHIEEGGLLRDAEDGLERLRELVPAGRERGQVVAEAGEPDDVERAVREVRLDVDLSRGLGAELRIQDVPQLCCVLSMEQIGLSALRTSFALSSMIPVSSRIWTAPNAGFSALRWMRCVSPSATSTPAPIICVSMRRDTAGFSYTSVVCRTCASARTSVMSRLGLCRIFSARARQRREGGRTWPTSNSDTTRPYSARRRGKSSLGSPTRTFPKNQCAPSGPGATRGRCVGSQICVYAA
jgi:hypothetical protein